MGVSGDLLGYVAAFLTTASFVPQALKTLQSQDTQSISLVMYLMFTSGVFFWFSYGVYKEDIPMMGANAIGFCLAAIILFCKIKNDCLRKR